MKYFISIFFTTLLFISASANALPAKRVLIIQGDQDEVVPLEVVIEWAAPQDLPIVVIPAAEHFFHGKLHIIKRTVLDWY